MPKKSLLRIFSIICIFVFMTNVTVMLPKKSTNAAQTAIEAQAECVMELNSRRIIYESGGDIRLPMASTTKILTCATVLTLCDNLEEKIAIPSAAVGVEGSSVYLKEGDIYSVKDLLYGLMLRSGNDCATALAIYCSGNIANFSAEMNKISQKAGALQSHFENPHGLPSENHFTTARDLALITCFAMQNATFVEIVSTKYYEPCHWKNKNKMLETYEGAIGVKTGYTKQAGRCLVSAATRNNMTLICTVLNCPTTYERSTQLLNDAFAAYEYTKVLSKNQILPIENTRLQGRVAQDYCYPVLPEEKEWLEIRTKPVSTHIKQGKNKEIVGQFEIYLAKRLLFSGNLYKL